MKIFKKQDEQINIEDLVERFNILKEKNNIQINNDNDEDGSNTENKEVMWCKPNSMVLLAYIKRCLCLEGVDVIL